MAIVDIYKDEEFITKFKVEVANNLDTRWKQNDTFDDQRILAVTLNPRFKDLNFLGTELQGHAYNELLKKGKEHQKKYPVIEVVENQGVSDSRPLKRQKHDMMTLLYGTTISKSMLL